MKKSYILLIIVLVLIVISLRSCSGYATNSKKCGSDKDCSGQGRYYKCQYYKGAGKMCSTT